MTYNLGITPIEGERWSCGAGYIIIPADVDRDQYILSCFNTGRVIIKIDIDGSIVTRVPIDINTINLIDFPEKPEDLGSCVFYVTEPIHKHPVVIAILTKNNELLDLREGQFKIKRVYGKNFVEITGSAKEEFIALNLQGGEKGILGISVNNKNKNAKVSLRVGGEIDSYTTGTTKLRSNESIILKTQNKEDESKNSSFTQTEGENNFQNTKFVINKGEEPMALGNVLQKFLDKFIDTVSQSTVTTSIGQMPLLNAQQIAALKQETSNILSKVGFLE